MFLRRGVLRRSGESRTLLGGEIGVDERAVSRRPGVVYGVEGVNETGRAASIAGDEWARPVGRAGTLW